MPGRPITDQQMRYYMTLRTRQTLDHLRQAAGHSRTVLQRRWQRFRETAGLKQVRLHGLLYSFASRALPLGETQPVIGKLPGANFNSNRQTDVRKRLPTLAA